MADYRRHEILSGLFVVLAVLVFCLFAFRIGGLDLLGLFRGPARACVAHFLDVKTLGQGAPVKAGGRAVGKVTEVLPVERVLSPEQARLVSERRGLPAANAPAPPRRRQLIEVRFELWDPALRLDPASAVVALGQESPLSSHYLELDPGEWDEARPAPRVLDELGPAALVLASRETAGINEVIAGVQPALNELSEILRRTNESFLNARNAAALETLLTDLGQVSRQAQSLLARGQGLLEEQLEPRLGALLEDLATTTRDLKGRIDGLDRRLQKVLDDAGGMVREAGGVLSDSRPGLAELVRRLRRASAQAELALRKIRANPAVLFFGDDESALETEDFDATWLRASGRAPPYTTRDEETEHATD
jgi:ABC-type transporter Mla subunit MlaD